MRKPEGGGANKEVLLKGVAAAAQPDLFIGAQIVICQRIVARHPADADLAGERVPFIDEQMLLQRLRQRKFIGEGKGALFKVGAARVARGKQVVIAIVAIDQAEGIGMPVVIAEAVAKIGGVFIEIGNGGAQRDVSEPEAVGRILQAEVHQLIDLLFLLR